MVRRASVIVFQTLGYDPSAKWRVSRTSIRHRNSGPRNPIPEEENERDHGQPYGRSVDELARDTERDNFMTAQDALDYGMIDKIQEPRIGLKPL